MMKTPQSAHRSRIPLVICLVALSVLKAPATEQFPDVLLHQGKTFGLAMEPLEPYLSKHPDRRPDASQSCSACWRGYVATWEIRGNELVLEKLEPCCSEPPEPVRQRFTLSAVFPESGDGPIHADWFTGRFGFAAGKQVGTALLWEPIFEKEAMFHVVDGYVIGATMKKGGKTVPAPKMRDSTPRDAKDRSLEVVGFVTTKGFRVDEEKLLGVTLHWERSAVERPRPGTWIAAVGTRTPTSFVLESFRETTDIPFFSVEEAFRRLEGAKAATESAAGVAASETSSSLSIE